MPIARYDAQPQEAGGGHIPEEEQERQWRQEDADAVKHAASFGHGQIVP